MLFALLVDRAGTGMWAASSVLYFTFVLGLDAGRIGLLLGAAAVAGIAGSPLAGHLAGRFPVRPLLIGSHLLRLGTLGALLVVTRFDVLLPLVAVTCLGDRAAKALEMLFATRVAGERRGTYQALARSTANAGYAVGAGMAAAGLALGTTEAYRALILANGLSFLAAAALVWRTREPRAEGRVAARDAGATGGAGDASGDAATGDAATGDAGPGSAATGRTRAPSPWRDRGYLRFVLLDIPMNLDDSVLAVGLPLWLVVHTDAPHALVPAFLVVNTVLVVALQLRVSARFETSRQAAAAVSVYGLTMLVCCVLLALSSGTGPVAASAVLLGAAVLVTGAELLRSVSSWELAVSLAPERARASYLGVAGMAQSVQKSAGPLLLTAVVTAGGPAGWLALGAGIAALSVVQRRCAVRRLDSVLAPPAPAAPSPSAAYAG
ncbi:MFS transporter [Streptomyces sp. NPDC051546]|uniref:MFS transporter n=1 Tax=Streptomyces sp. NPDC051546 TaxID=3365655 RepID=UPI0037BD427E